MIDIEKIKDKILKGEQIENIVGKIDWKKFEKIAMEILIKHDFNTIQNFRFKTERKFEIDILASDKNNVLVIDCKHWNRGRYKKTSLKYAVEEQKHRLEELKKFIKNNSVAKNKFQINEKTKFIPLIITWFEEDLLKHENTFIIPIWKFNEFLLNISEYI
jgi:Holliday junction resolvase-like predicted endonuclease